MVAASFQPQGQSESQSQPQAQPRSHVAIFTPGDLREQTLPPGERDFQVFEEVVIEGVSTRAAAARFGVSQTRIVQIRRRVADWMGTEVPPTPRLTPIQRLSLAAEIAEMRSDHLYSLALEGWRASQTPQETTCRGSLGDAAPTTRERHGDSRYLVAAMRITERRMHLSGTIHKVLAEAAERDSGIGTREENCSTFDVQSAMLGEQDGAKSDLVYPSVGYCSIPVGSAEDCVTTEEVWLDASACEDETCDDLENR